MNELFSPLFLLLVILWPLFLAGAVASGIARSTVVRIASWAALPAFLIAVFGPQHVTLDLSWVLLSAKLRLADGSDRLFLLFTVLLWWLSGMYAQSYLSDRPGQRRFFIYFLLSMTGNLGLILAQGLMSFYLFFALMSFASYGLVVHERSTEALRAGRVYIVLVVIGEIALFSAMILTVNSTGSMYFDTVRQQFAQAEPRNLIMILAFIGFGIKAGVLGLHMWLPLAHPVAPTPASAVLSGAMIKAGLLGWLRLLPLGEMAMLSWGKVFIVVGLATAFYGVLVGISQRVPKTVLAYSSISQMGIMIMAVGLGLTAPEAYPGIFTVITLYALHHGLNKGVLFLGVGVIGAFRGVHRRWVWLAMWLPALSLAGAPLTSGMLVKILLKGQAANAPESWVFVVQTLLSLSALATTLLVGRFVVLLFKPKAEVSTQLSSTGLVWPWGLLLAASVVLPWMLRPEFSAPWSLAAVAASLWPVVFGVVVVLVAVFWNVQRARHRGAMLQADDRISAGSLFSPIPPGDVLIPMSYVVKLFLKLSCCLFGELLPQWRDRLLYSMRQLWSYLNVWRVIGRFEAAINHWSAALGILLLLGLAIVILGVVE